MLERVVEYSAALHDTLTSSRELCHLVLSDDDLRNATLLIDIVQPFKNATLTLSSDYSPTLSDVSAVYQMLFDHLEKYSELDYAASKTKGRKPVPSGNNQSWIKEAANAGWKKLYEYYPTSDADVCIVATVLDPRLKLHWYKNVGWRKEWIDSAKKSVMAMWAKYKPHASSVAKRSTGTTSTPNIGAKKALFQNIFSQQMSDVQKSEDELKRYVAEAPANPDFITHCGRDGALGWWKMHANEFPNLSRMARDYLGASGSGVPVERFF